MDDRVQPAGFDPPSRMVIADLPGLRAISDPLRMRIVEELAGRERSVSEVAETLGTTRHRLYYHVRLLERHGLVRETGRRAVSGAVERLYRASARSFEISDQISPTVRSGTIATMFAQTMRDIDAEVDRSLDAGPSGDPAVQVLRGVAPLDERLHREFVRRLKDLMIEFEDSAGAGQQGSRRYGLLIAMAPVLEDPAPRRRTRKKKK